MTYCYLYIRKASILILQLFYKLLIYLYPRTYILNKVTKIIK